MRRRVGDSRMEISKTLSAILRRDAKRIGLDIDDDGWVKLTDVLATDVMTGIDEEMLLRVVEESNFEKARYELKTTEDEQVIRAIDKRKIVNVNGGYISERVASGQEKHASSVLMSVSGVHGHICEARISKDSTVMDARMAIFRESKTPLKRQQLVLGCTMLTDPSTRIVLNPMDEHIEVTCVLSSLDTDDVCTWCCNILGVPVEIICKCKALFCVTCIRDMTGLNGQPAKCDGCPICGTRLRTRNKSAASVYNKRVDLMAHLDQKYGKVDCPRKCGELYHRGNAQEHMDICPCTVKTCRACKESYTGPLDAHELQCSRPFFAFDEFGAAPRRVFFR